MMQNNFLMPKASYVYSSTSTTHDATPLGSHVLMHIVFYKHEIPSGFFINQNLMGSDGE